MNGQEPPSYPQDYCIPHIDLYKRRILIEVWKQVQSKKYIEVILPSYKYCPRIALLLILLMFSSEWSKYFLFSYFDLIRNLVLNVFDCTYLSIHTYRCRLLMAIWSKSSEIIHVKWFSNRTDKYFQRIIKTMVSHV